MAFTNVGQTSAENNLNAYFSNENSIQVFNCRIMSSGKGEKQSEVRKGGEKNPVTNKGVQRNCGSIPGRSDCRHVRLAFLRGKLSNLSAAVTNGSYRAEGINVLKENRKCIQKPNLAWPCLVCTFR